MSVRQTKPHIVTTNLTVEFGCALVILLQSEPAVFVKFGKRTEHFIRLDLLLDP